MKSQSEEILEYLKSGKSLTPLEALKIFGCLRLGARIFDLKAEGYPIKSEIIHSEGKHFSRYWMENTPHIKSEALPLGGFVGKNLANTQEVTPYYPKTNLEPLMPQIGLSIPNIKPPKVGIITEASTRGAPRQAFETAQGQYAFIG